MAHSIITNEISDKVEVDTTQMGDTSNIDSAKLLASQSSPPRSKEDETKALQLANRELQARLSGYLVLPQMMEKKAKECKRWKQRAYKAERNLKLITNILTRSQLEELQRQNVVPLHEESLSQLDTSADSSLESRALAGVNDRRFTRVTEQLQSDDMTTQSKLDSRNMTIDTDNVDILKQQIATYIEDFENERKDRERLVAVCDQQRRDLQVLHAEKKSIFRQLRKFEDEVHLLRQDNAAMKCKTRCREANYVRSSDTVVVAPELVSRHRSNLPTTDDDWICFSCSYKNNQHNTFCEICGHQRRKETMLSVDGPRLL